MDDDEDVEQVPNGRSPRRRGARAGPGRWSPAALHRRAGAAAPGGTHRHTRTAGQELALTYRYNSVVDSRNEAATPTRNPFQSRSPKAAIQSMRC